MPEPNQEQDRASPLERVAQQLESVPPAHPELPEVRGAERPPVAVPVPAAAPGAGVRSAPVEQSPLREDIEDALADDQLRRIYAAMPPEAQARLRTAAVRLADQLEAMVRRGRVIAAEVYRLITRWLRLIPRVNRWFLVQESKVKTDAILALASRARGQ